MFHVYCPVLHNKYQTSLESLTSVWIWEVYMKNMLTNLLHTKFRDSRKMHLERKVLIFYVLAFDFVIANTVM